VKDLIIGWLGLKRINNMTAVLLYNLFPKTIWKQVTSKMLSNVPHDSIVVHVTMPWYAWIYKPLIKKYLKQFNKVDKILFSPNFKKRGESIGFERFRKDISFEEFDIISYVHSKGTSRKRKNTKPIEDWTEMMRYFVVERLDLCQKAFEKGYYLYGVDLSNNVCDFPKYKGLDTKFIYQGNFVSINNRILCDNFLSMPCYKNYYGVERFWGNLCDMEKAFCVYYSSSDHYQFPYPDELYKNKEY
jgi:hypothetical protein